MAKIQNIYAIASDGTKITVTASAVGAVPTDQVATSSVLGLVKTGDNTIQGQENGIDVNYLEVNAAGKGFVPAFNIAKYFEPYNSSTGFDVIVITFDDYKSNIIVTTNTDFNGKYFESKPDGYEMYHTDEGWQVRPITFTDNDNGGFDVTILVSGTEVNVEGLEYFANTLNYKNYFQPDTINNWGLYFNTDATHTITDYQNAGKYTVEGYANALYEFAYNGSFSGVDNFLPWFVTSTILNTISADYSGKNADTFMRDSKGNVIYWTAEPSSGKKTANRVVIDSTVSPNIGIVDIDTFQHATTSQYGIVQFPADYYEDDGTPKIATTDKQGTLKIGTEYSAYTTEGSYTAAPLLLNSDNVGYVEVLPATTTAIGSIMVSNAETYDASTISNKTIAWVNLKDNKAFVYVNLASQQYRGSVRVQQKYTAYSTLDSQTAAYLRITDAGFGYVTVLPATTSTLGSFKASSAKYYDYNSTIGYTVAWVNINSNDLAYVVVKPATSSTLGCVIVSNKYTAYSTEDSQTAAYLRINSAGKAFIPMLTESWTFTVVDDNDNESTVEKKVVLG